MKIKAKRSSQKKSPAAPLDPIVDQKFSEAIRCHKDGETEKALAIYHEILDTDPEHKGTLNNLAKYYEGNGHLPDAITCYQKMLIQSPDDFKIHNDLGIIYLRQEQYERAKESFEKALFLNPDTPEAWNNLGLVFSGRKEYQKSLECFQKAILLRSNYIDAHNNLGGVYLNTGNYQEALERFQKVIAINPDHVGAYNNIGNVYKFRELIQEAESNYLKAIEINPDFPDANNNLGNIYGITGRIKQAIACYQKALLCKPDYKEAQGNLLLHLNYSSDLSPEDIFAEHLLFQKRFGDPLKSKISPHLNDKNPDRKLKIGYVSPDFRTHSIDSFLEPVLSRHDPGFFEVYCYSNNTVWDHMTRQLHSYADHWRLIAGLPDDEACELIRRDQIDILIDLCGHTGFNRMTLFAMKPAPVQVSWLGYPNTTGLFAIDYRITDHYADPVGMTERFHTERLVRMPDCFSCFRAPAETPGIETLPALKNGYITFGSFNTFAKVTRPVMKLWSEILHAVSGSRIILKNSGLNEGAIKESIYRIFGEYGISSDRVDLFGKDLSRRAHFQKYQSVDIGLDPFPYNGTTTTCDSLWMGVPVVTLEGKTHVSRVGVSQMHNLGLAEWIAKTPEEYIEIARNLSSNVRRLSQLREGMRARMLASPLMNANAFTRNLEKAYREIWKTYSDPHGEKGNKYSAGEEDARRLLRHGNLAEAEKRYLQILTREPQNDRVLQDLGILSFQTGKLQDARDYLLKAVQTGSEDAAVFNNLGVVLYEMRKVEEAKVCYERAISLKPGYAEAYYNIGIVFREEGDSSRAEGCIQQALKIKPDYSEARNSLEELKGNPQTGEFDFFKRMFAASLKQGNYSKAFELLSATLQRPVRPDGFIQVCASILIQFRAGILLQARAEGTEFAASKILAANAGSESPAALREAGMTALAAGKKEEAAEWFLKALVIRPGDPVSQNCFGVALTALGYPEEGKAFYAAALILKPDYMEALINCGSTLRNQNRIAEAIEYFKRALKLNPADAAARCNLDELTRGGPVSPVHEERPAKAVLERVK